MVAFAKNNAGKPLHFANDLVQALKSGDPIASIAAPIALEYSAEQLMHRASELAFL